VDSRQGVIFQLGSWSWG